jgi:Ran GTPase-activating protein (RanGAP) involved in mRNA processing and transport
VQENYGLKYLNLQMNGMGEEGARALGHALTHNQCLLELNISSNRITEDGAMQVARGLFVNEVLETLRVIFCIHSVLIREVMFRGRLV